MIRIFNIVFLSAALLFLAGCGTGYNFDNAQPQLVAEPDRVVLRLRRLVMHRLNYGVRLL